MNETFTQVGQSIRQLSLMLFAILPDRSENEIEVGLTGCFLGGLLSKGDTSRVLRERCDSGQLSS